MPHIDASVAADGSKLYLTIYTSDDENEGVAIELTIDAARELMQLMFDMIRQAEAINANHQSIN